MTLGRGACVVVVIRIKISRYRPKVGGARRQAAASNSKSNQSGRRASKEDTETIQNSKQDVETAEKHFGVLTLCSGRNRYTRKLR